MQLAALAYEEFRDGWGVKFPPLGYSEMTMGHISCFIHALFIAKRHALDGWVCSDKKYPQMG